MPNEMVILGGKDNSVCLDQSGALGKRTRFQQTFLAQLLLEVKRKEDSAAREESDGELSPAPTPADSLPKVMHP